MMRTESRTPPQIHPSSAPPAIVSADLPMIRRLQLVIDSCVGVLQRNDFLDYETELGNEELSDLSRFFYQSFQTWIYSTNESRPLYSYLFRSSTFSLFGHIIFNAQTFKEHKQNLSSTNIQTLFPSFLNMVTGTAGMGKSVSRYPFITLLMSAGVENVTTKKEGEGAFVFTKSGTRKTGIVKIKTELNGLPINFDTPSYLYTYDVRYFQPKVGVSGSAAQMYYPAAYTVSPTSSNPSTPSFLGQISVPSVEYFPYFVRLMIGTKPSKQLPRTPQSTPNHHFSIQNRLLDTTWHVIDDLEINEYSAMNPDEFHVLFSSPDGSRWRTLNRSDKARPHVIIESVVPKFTSQEEAGFLNTVEARDDIEAECKAKIQRGVELFSFVPRFVTSPYLCSKALFNISGSHGSTIPQNEATLFNESTTEKLIHFSCPQFDCNNWHTEFATDLANHSILDAFGVRTNGNYARFLKTLKNTPENFEKKAPIFRTFVLDAIAQGFFIKHPKRARSEEPVQIPGTGSHSSGASEARLPPVIGETNIHMRGPSNMRSAELPDLKTIPGSKLSVFTEDLECIFENHMRPSTVITRELPKAEDGSGGTPHQRDPTGAHQHLRSTDTSHTTSTNASTLDRRCLKCFTFALNVLGGNTVGIDSILLFFQVREDEGQWTIDRLSVMFIKSTLASYEPICESAPNLMYLWLCLLCAVYHLRQDQIYPHFIFVTPTEGRTQYGYGASTASFMDKRNIWKLRYDPDDARLEAVQNNGRLMVDNVDPLPPNDDPNHFRCAFCGLILTELFVDHKCDYVRRKTAHGSSKDTVWTVTSSDIAIRMSDHPESMTGVHFPQHTPKLVFNLHNASNRGDDGYGDQQRVFEIEFSNTEIRVLPTIHPAPGVFEMMDVMMIPVDQPVPPNHPPAAVNHPQLTKRSVISIHPTQPLPHFFSLVPPMSTNTVDHQTTDQLPQFSLLLATERNLGVPVERLGLDVSDPTSHLHATLNMIHLWVNGCKITFSETGGQIIPGKKIVASRDFDDLDLWKNESLPITPMHIPMSCFGTLPVFVNRTNCYTQSDIRSLLLSPDQSLPSPSALSMFNQHIGKGTQLSPDEVARLLKMPSARTPLLSADVAPLSARIPRLKSVNEYDLQLLLSVVNGTQNRISEILGHCCEYLDSPPRLPQDKTALDAMELNLSNGYSTACQRLQPFLDRLKTGDGTSNAFGEDSFELRCLEDDALLPRWHQSLLIPWVMNDTQRRAAQYPLERLSSEPLPRHDRWNLMACMIIHAPICQSDRILLTPAINQSFDDANKAEFTSLVDGYSDKSSEQQLDLEIQSYSVLWDQTLWKLRNGGSLTKQEAQFLHSLLSKQAPKLDNTDDLIVNIKNCSISSKDRETLIALVCGLPRLTAEFRHNILRNMTALTEDERHELMSSSDSMLSGNSVGKTLPLFFAVRMGDDRFVFPLWMCCSLHHLVLQLPTPSRRSKKLATRMIPNDDVECLAVQNWLVGAVRGLIPLLNLR
ncbi:hypothetical protein BLNAU_23047 [Blattamonas nauphoetae]|uniref:Uncharacterized protein n=1 Tax=Blattamonas nauphoetae TaxID=2049346 RepID=A0ABQ9WRT3_9EUKA|nr:hypothetical protein BLNAU_23047 [Blattamonas nauphoetae]